VNQSSRFTACLPFLTEDVHGIPEERMPIVERYSVAVELDFALGPNCGTRSDLALTKQLAHTTFLCRFLPMVAVMQTTEARVRDHRCLRRRLRFDCPTLRCVFAQAVVNTIFVIQVSNRTPILGNYETFVIHGIPGATAR